VGGLPQQEVTVVSNVKSKDKIELFESKEEETLLQLDKLSVDKELAG
jgi:hypothetical protein